MEVNRSHFSSTFLSLGMLSFIIWPSIAFKIDIIEMIFGFVLNIIAVCLKM